MWHAIWVVTQAGRCTPGDEQTYNEGPTLCAYVITTFHQITKTRCKKLIEAVCCLCCMQGPFEKGELTFILQSLSVTFNSDLLTLILNIIFNFQTAGQYL